MYTHIPGDGMSHAYVALDFGAWQVGGTLWLHQSHAPLDVLLDRSSRLAFTGTRCADGVNGRLQHVLSRRTVNDHIGGSNGGPDVLTVSVGCRFVLRFSARSLCVGNNTPLKAASASATCCRDL